MPHLTSEYQAPLWFINKHLHTVYPTLFRKGEDPNYERQRLSLSDGDFVDIDWLRSDSNKLVILCHGLEGSSKAQYMRGMAKALSSYGFDVVALNFRGCSGEPNKKPSSYHSGLTSDLDDLLSYVRNSFSYSQIHLLGFSLGGNVILKYLGERGSKLINPSN